MSTLGTRLNKLERSIPAPEKQRRVICIVAADGDETGVRQLLEAEGYDSDAGDLVIINSIVSPPGQPQYSEPPYILHR